LFHDPLADQIAGERGHAIVAAAPRISWAVVARTKIIDNLVLDMIGHGCDRVLNLAAGLDTRPYRLDLPSDLTWAEGDLELTGGRGVDIVVDPVGGDRFTDSLRSLAPGGRLLVIGFTGGDIPTVKVNRLLLNNVDVVGVGWGAWTLTHPGYLGEQWAELEPLLASGKVSAPEPVVYPLERAADAIASLEDRTAKGKVVVKLR
jgi:NADPH:quinone reductase-like Zn-dependent oxidoreductase